MDEINKSSQNESLNKSSSVVGQLEPSPRAKPVDEQPVVQKNQQLTYSKRNGGDKENTKPAPRVSVKPKVNTSDPMARSKVSEQHQQEQQRYKSIYNTSWSDASKDFKDEDLSSLDDKTVLDYTTRDNHEEYASEPNDISALERINELVMRSVERTKRTAMYLSGEDNDISFLLNGNRPASGTPTLTSAAGVAPNKRNGSDTGSRRFSASTVKTLDSQMQQLAFCQEDDDETGGNSEPSMVNRSLNESHLKPGSNMTRMNASDLTTPGHQSGRDTKLSDMFGQRRAQVNEFEQVNAQKSTTQVSFHFF
jgi:hypothetical protein